MNAWALITVTALASMLGSGALFAAACRRADFAVGMGVAAGVLAVALAGYANGLRAHVYDAGAIATVRIVSPKAITDRVRSLPAPVPPPHQPN